MAAINFPDNPTPGEEFTAAGRTWVWNDTADVWESLASSELPPLAHAPSHEDGGIDELELAQSQVTNLTTDLAGKSGLIAAEPSANTNTATSVGYVGLPQVILSTGGLTLSKAHAGEHIYVTGSSQTVTIPANASVPFEIGTTIVVINGNVTSSIAITSDTLRLAGGTTTGTRSLAVYGMATLVKVAATTWIASGNGLT